MKTIFHKPERLRALVREWDSLSLNVVMSQASDKTPYECLEMLIAKMSYIQSSLPEEYRIDSIFRDKLVNAVRHVNDCRVAYQKPADTVQGVLSDLHASLVTSKRVRENEKMEQVDFTLILSTVEMSNEM